MHMQGVPSTMQENPNYKNIIPELITFFSDKIITCHSNKISDVIIDPGFGFGKKINQNFKILKNLEVFQVLNVPIMVGLSRKSMIYKVLDTHPKNSLNGTTSLNTVSLLKGANILRVHDVNEVKQSIKIFKSLYFYNG